MTHGHGCVGANICWVQSMACLEVSAVTKLALGMGCWDGGQAPVPAPPLGESLHLCVVYSPKWDEEELLLRRCSLRGGCGSGTETCYVIP